MRGQTGVGGHGREGRGVARGGGDGGGGCGGGGLGWAVLCGEVVPASGDRAKI